MWLNETICKKCIDKWETHLQLKIVKGQRSSGKCFWYIAQLLEALSLPHLFKSWQCHYSSVRQLLYSTISWHCQMIKSILMLWIIRPKYLMMPLKISQSKEINLQQLPMMSETTLLTTSTVIMALLNGKMIAHKIEFKIRVIILNKGTLMLNGWPVSHWPETQPFTMLISLKQGKFLVDFLANGWPLRIKVRIWHPWGTVHIINILYQRNGLRPIHSGCIFVMYISIVNVYGGHRFPQSGICGGLPLHCDKMNRRRLAG